MTYKALEIKLRLNGNDHIVTPINPDTVRWEHERRKNNWPAQQDAPNLFTNVLAWSAMTRTGLFSGTIEQFIEQVEYIEAGAIDIPPTNGATPGEHF